MKLSAEQFVQIVETLRSDPPFGRRVAPRVGLRLRATLIPCIADEPVTRDLVWVRDLSTTGIGFVHKRGLPHGAFVIVQFQGDGAAQVSVLYKVQRSRQVGSETFEIGAAMDHVLTAEELGE
jgi:hypothetical protein